MLGSKFVNDGPQQLPGENIQCMIYIRTNKRKMHQQTRQLSSPELVRVVQSLCLAECRRPKRDHLVDERLSPRCHGDNQQGREDCQQRSGEGTLVARLEAVGDGLPEYGDKPVEVVGRRCLGSLA